MTPEENIQSALYLKFDVQSQCRHEHWTAVLIVSAIIDVLQARSKVNSAPDMRRVVGFHNVFAAIAKRAVAQQETQSSIGKINLMVLANAVGD